MQVSSLDYSSYVGVIGIGRIQRGTVKINDNVSIINKDGKIKNGKILQILGFLGLARIEKQEASAGEIIMFSGIDGVKISDTVCDPKQVEALPPLIVDEPTISMTFQVNSTGQCRPLGHTASYSVGPLVMLSCGPGSSVTLLLWALSCLHWMQLLRHVGLKP